MNAVIGGAGVHVTASTPLAESGGGVLHTVTVNTAGSAGASLTLHDGPDASHPVLAVIDATVVDTFTFDARLAAGLYCAVSGSPDVTVVVLPAPGLTP